MPAGGSGGFPDDDSRADGHDESMTKSLATAALALIATLASVAPVAAATHKGSDREPSVKVTRSTDNLFDIEYWGLKYAERTDSRIAAQSGDGGI